jgi:hypothetical protein
MGPLEGANFNLNEYCLQNELSEGVNKAIRMLSTQFIIELFKCIKIMNHSYTEMRNSVHL